MQRVMSLHSCLLNGGDESARVAGIDHMVFSIELKFGYGLRRSWKGCKNNWWFILIHAYINRPKSHAQTQKFESSFLLLYFVIYCFLIFFSCAGNTYNMILLLMLQEKRRGDVSILFLFSVSSTNFIYIYNTIRLCPKILMWRRQDCIEYNKLMLGIKCRK